MKNSNYIFLLLSLTIFSCKKSAFEKMNISACSCFEEKNKQEIKLENDVFECLEFSNFEEFENELFKENSTLNKEEQGEERAIEYIHYSFEHCKNFRDYFKSHRDNGITHYKEVMINRGITLKTLKDSLENANLDKMTLAGAFIAFEEYDIAERLLNEILLKNPNSENGMVLLAMIYEQEEDYDQAIKLYEEIIKINPSDVNKLSLKYLKLEKN